MFFSSLLRPPDNKIDFSKSIFTKFKIVVVFFKAFNIKVYIEILFLKCVINLVLLCKIKNKIVLDLCKEFHVFHRIFA